MRQLVAERRAAQWVRCSGMLNTKPIPSPCRDVFHKGLPGMMLTYPAVPVQDHEAAGGQNIEQKYQPPMILLRLVRGFN